jgi:hypothetical protein
MSGLGPRQQPVSELTDIKDLKAYQQLSDDLRAFEVVMMYHFFKKEGTKEKTKFADDVEKSLEGAYTTLVGLDPKTGFVTDCGPYCADRKLCRPC